MRPTQKDIAQMLGVSSVSVSKALRGTGNISDEMRQRILQVAGEMRYRRNGVASAMREGRTGMIGLIYTSEGVKGNLPQRLLNGIQRSLSERSFELILGEVLDSDLASPGKASGLMREWMADGLLINNQVGLPPQVAELVDGEHVPAIWMNSKLERNCIYFDERRGAEMATERLLALGHRRIGYVDFSHPVSMLDGDAEHYSVIDRHGGYVDTMRKAGLPPRVFMLNDIEEGRDARTTLARKWLVGPDRPTAMLCYGTTTMLPILFAAAMLGLSVPRDLSVMQFAGSLESFWDHHVGGAIQDYSELGRRSVEKLLDVLSGTPEARFPTLVPISVEAGTTTAAPPSVS